MRLVIEQLKADLDRLHRERDSFAQQCSVMAEENSRLLDEKNKESARLEFLIGGGTIDVDFDGNYYAGTARTIKSITLTKFFDGGNCARTAIDKAMEGTGK
jgi:FtsZ-binding cell division protein ZapB